MVRQPRSYMHPWNELTMARKNQEQRGMSSMQHEAQWLGKATEFNSCSKEEDIMNTKMDRCYAMT